MNQDFGRKMAAGLAMTMFLAGSAAIMHRYPQSAGIVVGGLVAILMAVRWSPWSHLIPSILFMVLMFIAILIGPTQSGIDHFIGWSGLGGGTVYVFMHSINAFLFWWRRLFRR